MKVLKRDHTLELFSVEKILKAIEKAYKACNYNEIDKEVIEEVKNLFWPTEAEVIGIESIQDGVEKILIDFAPYNVAKAYIIYRAERKRVREYAKAKQDFINKYKGSKNTADATIDDNSNVANKNIGVLNSEIHKEDNIQVSRAMVTAKLKELFPEFDYKQYIKDLEHHIIYKHDESSFAGAIAPYCCSISMYPFLLDGIKKLGGLSAAPKNLDSFCGMYINLIFATSSMFAGAVATSEFLVYFDYFARKEWGNDYYKEYYKVISKDCLRRKTILSQIHQYFQEVIYSINQPAAARGMQSAFVNFSIFDREFFNSMFEFFVFPDGDKPVWESVNWLQKEFMVWFNKERLKTILTFPVLSTALVYKDSKFLDEEMADFIAQQYSEGNSFFTYISDTVDSLSSCCRLKNVIQTKEFNFTNGNMGIMTGSKSVITLNLNRIVQDWAISIPKYDEGIAFGYKIKIEKNKLLSLSGVPMSFEKYLNNILERTYKYHVAYNELLWDMYNANLLPVYKAGFIHLDKQYLTIGINGLNQAAEFLGVNCNDNTQYKLFCQTIFRTIKEFNQSHNGKFNGHTISLNTECVPAESLAIKNYNWDKQDGYEVSDDTNLYASYIFKPNDKSISFLQKLELHGRDYIGDYLDGGSACHINFDSHPSWKQCKMILKHAAEVGCSYFTFNIPNSECEDCGYITKVPIKECPKCGSTRISLWDRVIGYLTKIKNWSEGRQIEQKTRVYENVKIEE